MWLHYKKLPSLRTVYYAPHSNEGQLMELTHYVRKTVLTSLSLSRASELAHWYGFSCYPQTEIRSPNFRLLSYPLSQPLWLLKTQLDKAILPTPQV